MSQIIIMWCVVELVTISKDSVWPQLVKFAKHGYGDVIMYYNVWSLTKMACQ